MTTDQSQRGIGAGPHDDTALPQADEPPARRRADDEHKGLVRAALFSGRPLPPERLGRFVLRGTLGHGGMGTVLEAYDATLDRKVALKLLHRDVVERHAERLVREAQALAKLSHPNVVQVYEVGEVEGRTFIAMELVRGQTLLEWQQQHPRPGWRKCVDAYLQAGRGLAAAHAAGLVHRDFKPGNCIIDDEGRVRVLDFGLVRELNETTPETIMDEEPGVEALRALDEADELVRATSESTCGAPLTRPGAVMGTMAYMPLEQLEGRRVDARGDLFSFCVSLYEAVYGERPFDDESAARLSTALAKGEVRPPARGSEVPSKLRALLVRGLARDPSDRWPSMAALLAELERVAARRPGRWAAIGLALGVIGVGTAAWLQPAAITVQERCDGAEGRLADVWDEGRKHAVEAALLGSGKAFAPQTWQRVETRLDEYSAAWASKYTAACEAAGQQSGPSEEDTGRIFACLGQRRVALRDAVDVLASADAELVSEAVGLVSKLPGLERCDDVEALRAELPPPEDPVIAAEVELLRERLSKVGTLASVGRHYLAVEDVDAVVTRAEAIGYAPLLAEALLHRGMVREANAAYAEAQHDLERAYALGLEHEHDRIALHAALGLTRLVGAELAKHEQGLQWGQTALALASKPAVDPRLGIDALRALARVLRAQGKHEAALEHLRRALERSEALDRQDPLVAFVLDDMAQVLRGLGRLEESLEHERRALAIFEALPGDPDPDITIPLTGISFGLRQLGRYDEALAYLERDLAISERVYGPDHPLTVTSWMNLAEVLLELGRPEDAAEYVELQLKWIEGHLGPRHPDLLIGLDQLGSILEQQGKPEDALRHHERALALAEAIYGPDNVNVLPSLDAVVRNLMDQGRLDEARVHAERSVEVAKAAFGSEHSIFAEALATLGSVLRHQGKLDEALERFERGLSIEEAADPKGHRVAGFLWEIGDVQLRQRHLDEALASFRRALSITESTLGPEHPDVYRVALGLAEVELERHEPEQARTHAERAVAMLEAGKAGVAPNRRPLELAWARFVLAQALWTQTEARPRAHALAEQARDALVDGKRRLDTERGESVRAWLAQHRAP